MLTQSSSTDSPVNVQVLVLRGGGGHYATFLALKAILAVQRPHWQLTPIFADRLGEAAQQTAGGRIADTLGSGSDQFYDTILKLGFGWIHLITVHIHKVLIRLRLTGTRVNFAKGSIETMALGVIGQNFASVDAVDPPV